MLPGAPASGSLRPGDRVVAIDGRAGSVQAFIDEIAADRCAGAQVDGCRGVRTVQITVLRGGRRITLALVPRYSTNPLPARPRVGVAFAPLVVTHRLGVGAASRQSLDQMWSVTSLTVTRVGQIFTSSAARKQLHTVVGVTDVVSQDFSYSTAAALYVLALLSLSLAIINLFPFLPLDGGHIFWAIAEKLRGRAIPFSVMERASIAGFALVLVVFAIGLSNDIHTFANGGFHVQ